MREHLEQGLPINDRRRKRYRWLLSGRWKNDLMAVLLLTAFAFWVNRGISIKGLYMDDLYLWSCYGEQSFVEFVFPVGSTRFRFLYYLAAWLELALVGRHVEWLVPLNILLNAGIAFTLYQMARRFSRSSYVGILTGIAFLSSRMAYYQISQVYGLMETMALWMALGILCCLCRYLTDIMDGWRGFRTACGLYFGICFVHERYMVLLPLFFLVLVFRRERNWRRWAAPVGVFAAVQAIRLGTIGRLMPAGTGRTQVAETFSMGTAVKYALSQVAYLFGFNAGPQHLNGQNFRQAPLWVLAFVIVADIMLAGMVLCFLIKWVREHRKDTGYFRVSMLFLGFIGGCIACSSVTIRVEMRWIYVSYAASLLYLAWIFGALTEGILQKGLLSWAVHYVAMITAYVVLMLPVELYGRSLYPNLYFWPDQLRYNSLAEVTYGVYGDGLFGKHIYIIGNDYDMSDFTAETFFKVFDRERKAEGTQVTHIDDVRDIGLVTGDMLVLQEDPAHNRFLDVTEAVRLLKFRSLYGYYPDNWMDEQARVQVMAGSTGEIGMNFYYPRELTSDQWITISVNGEPQVYLEMDADQKQAQVQVQPYETVTLELETNFYVPQAQEQRGEKKLAVLVSFTAD